VGYEDHMKPASGTQRLGAMAVAVGATFSMVWALATLGYPANASAGSPLAAAALQQACAQLQR
jgi:hypothetical protein